MALEPADMNKCDRKCKCSGGANNGELYPCDNPCAAGSSFNSQTCDCETDAVEGGCYSVAFSFNWNGVKEMYKPCTAEGDSVSKTGYINVPHSYIDQNGNVFTWGWAMTQNQVSCVGGVSLSPQPCGDGTAIPYFPGVTTATASAFSDANCGNSQGWPNYCHGGVNIGAALYLVAYVNGSFSYFDSFIWQASKIIRCGSAVASGAPSFIGPNSCASYGH